MTALSWLQKMRRANWRGGFERTAVHAAMPTQKAPQPRSLAHQERLGSSDDFRQAAQPVGL